MTTQTQTLAGFLLARITEDEYEPGRDIPEMWVDEAVALEARTADAGVPAFIAVTSARVLAECEAKRSIVAEHVDGGACMTTLGPVEHACACCRVPCPCPTLRALALPYADHPEYRDEWRP